jgi:hypothetical protein
MDINPICVHCDEPVLPGEAHPYHTPPAHIECVLLAVLGSVAHLQRRCWCYVPGSEEGDPPGMTRREAALAAVALHVEMRRLGIGAFSRPGASVN